MTSPDPDKYVSAGLDPAGSGQVLIERSLVGDDGLVELRHPTLPGQPIRVFPAGVAARMLAGWAPAAPEQPAAKEQAEPEIAPPPKGGAGSGVEAWAAYAARRGVEVPDGATREQIQSLLRDAGVPVESEPPAEDEAASAAETTTNEPEE